MNCKRFKNITGIADMANLSPHRRWALDVLIEAIKSESWGIADVIDKRTGKRLQMVGKITETTLSNVKFVPVALLMDSRLLEDYTPVVETEKLIVPSQNGLS
jgi:hypothetical protein